MDNDNPTYQVSNLVEKYCVNETKISTKDSIYETEHIRSENLVSELHKTQDIQNNNSEDYDTFVELINASSLISPKNDENHELPKGEIFNVYSLSIININK